jgi:hypothetical protein
MGKKQAADPTQCATCGEHQNQHCSECWACPDTGHLNTCSHVDEGSYYL